MATIFDLPEIITLSGEKLDSQMNSDEMIRAAGGNGCGFGGGSNNGCPAGGGSDNGCGGGGGALIDY